MPNLRIRIDEWILPSHTQAARVAEGSLDLAIAWIEKPEVERQNLASELLKYERLQAVMPGAHPSTRHDAVPASEITVLVDIDEASWDSWNRYALAFAKASGASTSISRTVVYRTRLLRARRTARATGAAVPKRHAAPMPPTLTRRRVKSPAPLWAWHLLRRSDGHARPWLSARLRH